jgi:16S rRNA (cytosine1402-N4)-methyltransferase
MGQSYSHLSVLAEETVGGLGIERKPGGIYFDGTVGGGGHSKEILSRLNGDGFLLGVDRDKEALEYAGGVLEQSFGQYLLVWGNFCDIKEICVSQSIESIDGAVLDLGVSSYQLDSPQRGFSYMNDAPLSMKMDTDAELSAYDVVNKYDEKRLSSLIYFNSEERWAKRIAEFIVAERQKKPIETTFELVSVIKKAIPKGARQDGPHPAKRTFQAIRIEVNNELDILGKAIKNIVDCLNPGGRISVIAFHSLEFKIVKQTFRELENPCECPRELPVCVCGRKPVIKIITRKPIVPSEAEVLNNNRSRSAKLMIAEKL